MKGLVVLSLLAEFLRHAQLESTFEVFTHEAELSKLSILDRDDLIKLLNLDPKPDSSLLSALLSTHRKLHSELQTVTGSSEKSNSLDGAQSTRSSRIPVLRTRRSSAPTSFDPTHKQHNGHGCDADGLYILSNSVEDHHPPYDRPRSGVNNPQANQYITLNDLSPSMTHDWSDNPAPSPAVELLKMDCRLNGSPACPNSSPRGEDYRDDFFSPVSVNSQRTFGAADHHHELDKRCGSQSAVSIHLIESARSLTPVNSSSPRVGEVSRPTSRSGTSSVVRIYSRASRRSASAEESSDVDGDDDDDEPISELLREYSVAEDSVDQTIDSDQSLGLDHVELVNHPRDISSPSH